jgi:hypothetical protein
MESRRQDGTTLFERNDQGMLEESVRQIVLEIREQVDRAKAAR